MAFQSPYPAAKSNMSTSPLEVAVTLTLGYNSRAGWAAGVAETAVQTETVTAI